jgi:FkbM family methyltransferase
MMTLDLRTDQITADEIRMLVGRDDAVILDVGSNNGGHSRMFLKTFPAGIVHAFEPDPRCIKKWRAATKDQRATLHEVAVGDADGTVTFHISDGREAEGHPEGWDSSGSLLPPTDELYKRWPWLKFGRTQTVPCIRLDTWFATSGLDHIDFIHADVQGAEMKLIAGAQQTLAKTRYFYTEYGRTQYYEGQPSLDSILQALPGFEILHLWKDDVLLKHR